MTDKELKKLSRLELLELLLVESQENQRLRDELDRVKSEDAIGKSVARLQETSDQLYAALQQVLSMDVAAGAPREKKEAEASAAKKSVDGEIYKRILLLVEKNPEVLDAFPEDLRKTIIDRIHEVREMQKVRRT